MGKVSSKQRIFIQISIEVLLQIVTIGVGYPSIERFFMKKTFITILTFLVSAIFMGANAAMVIMDYQGDTFVRPNSIERNLLINSNDGGEYDIAIRPLDNALVRSDGEVRIPLENVYINNTHEDVYMRYNEYSNILKRIVMGGIPRSLTLKVRDYGMVPAGVYNLNIEIQALDSDTQSVEGTTTFNLQIIVPKVQSISFHGESAYINIGTKDAFARNKKITTETNPMLYINSNCNWILTLRTNDFDNKAGNYYVRTVSASPNVNERLQERVLIEPNREIIIAKGKAPANNEFVTIEFAVEGKDGNIIRAGEYNNHLKFRLSEDRGR